MKGRIKGQATAPDPYDETLHRKIRPYKSCIFRDIFECVSKMMLGANLSHAVQYVRGFLKLIRVKIRVRKIKW